jgi:hypothetical protein
MIQNIFILSTILLTTGCATRILTPEMELTLIDKVTKKPITQAINTANVSLNKKSQIILKKIVNTQLPAPSAVYKKVKII